MNIFNSIANFVVGTVIGGLSLVGIQTPITPPTLTLSAAPTVIQAGESTVIEWASKGAMECTGTRLNTGSALSGSVTVSPQNTTTYSITCSKTETSGPAPTGVWEFAYRDVTDLWCTTQQPSFRNFYTENPCPSGNPGGQSCAVISESCAVNKWSTGVGDFKGETLYCNLISEVYRCVQSSAGGAPTSAPPVTVYNGEFGNLVAPHLQYRAILQQNVDQNGGPFVMDGFYDDKATADRVCSVLFPGSVNGSYKSDKYKSPKNNTVIRWDGSRWTQQNARYHPKHLRYNFTCVTSSAAPTPTPPVTERKEITKSVTVVVHGPSVPAPDPTGPGGTGGGNGQCSDGIDNDNDGYVDYPADSDCSSGSGSEFTPGLGNQCTDGIDNNGNGRIDLDDPACESASDPDEGALPPAASSLTVDRWIVSEGSAVTLTWSAENVEKGSCRLSGNNADSWGPFSEGTGSVTSSALTAVTDFTFSCTDYNGEAVSQSVTVRIVPRYREE